MPPTNLEECWAILRNYDRKIIIEYPDHLNCKICRKVVIDAVQTECGCLFCQKCIEKNMLKHCPGNGSYCNRDKGINTSKDHKSNLQVIELRAKCPNNSCTFDKELKELPSHMKECTKAPVKCPFELLGCAQGKQTCDSICGHLHAAVHQHSIKIAGFLIKTDAKVSDLSNELLNIKEPFESTKKQLENAKIALEQQKIINNDNERKLKEANVVIRSLTDKTEKLTAELNTVNAKITEITDEFLEFQKKINDHFDEIRETEQRKEFERKKIFKEQHEENLLLRKELENVIKFKSDISSSLLEFQTKSKNIFDHLVKQNYGEFIWKIDHFSDKRRSAKEGQHEEISSPPFYSHKNGYKLQLKLTPNGSANWKGRFVGIFFYVLVGNFDDILSWPLREAISISIIDQETKEEPVRVVYKYDNININDRDVFNRQKTNTVGFGSLNFCDLNILSRGGSLLKNDALYIRCSVGSPSECS